VAVWRNADKRHAARRSFLKRECTLLIEKSETSGRRADDSNCSGEPVSVWSGTLEGLMGYIEGEDGVCSTAARQETTLNLRLLRKIFVSFHLSSLSSLLHNISPGCHFDQI
jgi:hypothetical protein